MEMAWYHNRTNSLCVALTGVTCGFIVRRASYLVLWYFRFCQHFPSYARCSNNPPKQKQTRMSSWQGHTSLLSLLAVIHTTDDWWTAVSIWNNSATVGYLILCGARTTQPLSHSCCIIVDQWFLHVNCQNGAIIHPRWKDMYPSSAPDLCQFRTWSLSSYAIYLNSRLSCEGAIYPRALVHEMTSSYSNQWWF